MPIYRIRDWSSHFENASSRKLKRLDWVAIPNKTDGEGYTALVDHPDAAAHLGAWYAIVEAASKQKPRGLLPGGIPHDIGGICRSLGRMSRLPSTIFMDVIPRLVEIGWVEIVDENTQVALSLAESADVLAESADVLAESAAIAAAHNRELQGTTGKGTTANCSLPQNGNKVIDPREYPKTCQAIIGRFPSADRPMMSAIIHGAVQAYISSDDPHIQPLTDGDIAEAVNLASKEVGSKQTSAGLYRTTVPAVIRNWTQFGKSEAQLPKGKIDWDSI